MQIAHLNFSDNPLFLAPMEDVTNPNFRMLCKRYGADMVYTEFISADALIRSVSRTEQKLTINEGERPVAIQLYGKDPVAMAEAAQIAESAHPDIIDINFGCPVKKVAGKGLVQACCAMCHACLPLPRPLKMPLKHPLPLKPVWVGTIAVRLSSIWQKGYKTKALLH